MTVQSGLVPLLDEQTGRFPDEFAPPSVAADAVAAQDAAEAAGRAQEAAEAAENNAAGHEREAGQIVEDATATIPGLISEQVTAQIDPKVAAATQAKDDAETARGAAQTARDDALQAKAQAVASGAVASAAAEAAAADAERAEVAAGQATAPTDEMVAGLIETPRSDTAMALSSTFGLVVTPERFGAVGDGVTDDAEALQAALDFGKDSGLQTTVRLLPGRTYVAKNLHPRSNTLFDLTGATIQHGGSNGGQTVEGSYATINASGTAESPITGLRVVGGTVRGGRINYVDITGAGGNDGLYFYRCPGVVVEGVTLTEHGQDACTFDQSDGGKFLSCTVTNCGDAGIELRSGSNYEVQGCSFTTVGNGVATKPNVIDVRIHSNLITSFREGVLVHGFRWKITGNTILATAVEGYDGAGYQAIRYADDWSASIDTLSGTDILIAENTIDGRTSAAAITVLFLSGSNTLTDVKILGNTIANGKRGVQMALGSSVLISSNRISTTSTCVWLTGTVNMDVSITGNHLTTSTENYCIDVSCPGTIITGNRITGIAGGVRLASTATDCEVTANAITQTGSGIGISLSAARSQVVGNAVLTAGAIAVTVQGADCSVANNTLRPTGGEGVLVGASGSDTAGRRATVATNRIIGGTHAIRVYADAVSIISNCASGAQYWGVNVMAGALAALVLANYLAGNGSGGMQDAGTSTVADNNVLT